MKASDNDPLIPHSLETNSDFVEIIPGTDQKSLEWLAVLGAAGIHYNLVKIDRKWRIQVQTENHELAMRQLQDYELECLHWPPKLDLSGKVSDTASIPSMFAGLGLFAFFIITGPYNPDSFWFLEGRGDTLGIQSGEIWRAVTALTLHSDFGHVFGNVIGCIFLGGAVCQSFGNGMGWLLILVGGVGANLLNSFMPRTNYFYVGASTSVFVAIGILGANQFIRSYRYRDPFSYRTVLPIISVFAILSVLGTGPKADLLGHFTGAVCGLVLGSTCSPLQKFQNRIGIQFFCLGITAFSVVIAWRFALGIW